MVTRQVRLTEAQNETLEQLAASQSRTVGDLIREGVDLLSESEVAANLVQRIEDGDESAEEEIVERYGKSVQGMLRRVAPEQAEDLLRDTFRVALEQLRLRQLQYPESLAAFLARTAVHLALQELRRRRQRTDAEDERLARAAEVESSQLSAESEVKRHLKRSLAILTRAYTNEARSKRVPSLSERESELLLAINRGLSSEVAERYHKLIRRRQAGVLSPEEHRELLRLTDEVERLQAERIATLSELARLRGVSLDSLMEELEIRPASNA